jgi:surface antigen
MCCGLKAAECLGDCTWYAYGRMLDLGYSEVQMKFALHHSAEKWDDSAVVYLGASCLDWTPSVGAVAHRDYCMDNYDDTIKIGHVAVVESVNADGTITVTESNLDCDFTSVSDYLWRHRTVYPPVIDPDATPQCVKFSDFIHMPYPLYTISGKITFNGTGLAGVTMTLTNITNTSNGTHEVPVQTGSDGTYFINAATDSYTLTPSMPSYTFTPASISVAVKNANAIGQNFMATRTELH